MHVNVREVRLFTAEDLYYLSFAKDVLFSFLERRMRNNFVYVPCRCCYLSIHQSVSVALWGWGEEYSHLFPVITSLLAPFTFVHCLQSTRWLLVHKVRGGVEEQAKGVWSFCAPCLPEKAQSRGGKYLGYAIRWRLAGCEAAKLGIKYS